jgi:beta propeller repeat protein
VRKGLALAALAACPSAFAAEFDIRQVADTGRVNREPSISESGLAAWTSVATNDGANIVSDIGIYKDGSTRFLTQESTDGLSANTKPFCHSNTIVWVASFPAPVGDLSWVLREVPDRDNPVPELPARYAAHEDGTGNQWFEPLIGGTNAGSTNTEQEIRRHPSGNDEIVMWKDGGDIRRITNDNRDDYSASVWGNLLAWQIAKGWPFGWEIMIWDDGTMKQLTTNYYYDMAPRVSGSQVVWYGWDGHDFEIYLYDKSTETTIQVTSNQFDDVAPVIADGMIAWEGYASAEADVYVWKDGQVRKVSDNIEDDFGPRTDGGQVVWQGFDGDDFEIYMYDGEKTTKLTSNLYDDTNPDIADGMVCWMGYVDNWDAEIFVAEGKANITQLTDNEDEDRDPKTAGRRVIWQSDHEGKSQIFIATPKE